MKTMLVLGFFISRAVAGNDMCPTNFPSLSSILDGTSKILKDVSPESRDEQKREITQSAVLKSKDVTVTFKISGCSHVSYSFTFDGVKPKGRGSFAIFSAAESLMESTPVLKGDKRKDALIDALEKGKVAGLKRKDAKTFPLPCGEARCELNAQDDGKIILSYDRPF